MKAVPIKAISKVKIDDILQVLKGKGYSQNDIKIILEVLMESQVK